MRRECVDCMNYDHGQCQMVEQIEEPVYCPELRDHVRFHELKLYGAAGHAFSRLTKPR